MGIGVWRRGWGDKIEQMKCVLNNFGLMERDMYRPKRPINGHR